MAISRLDMERQLRNMGGRIGFQEGGIMPRLNQLGSGVTSAEQMLQGINQRLESAESSLGGSGGNQFSQVTLPETLIEAQRPSGPIGIRPDFNAMVKPLGKPLQQLQQADPNSSLLGTFQSRPENTAGPMAAIPSGVEVLQTGVPAAGYADGGIASLQEPRQGYFLGKIVKKAKRAVKKVVKSPIGKAAILGGLTFGVPGTSFGGLAGKGSIGSFFGKGSFNPLKSIIEKKGFGALTRPSGLAKLLGKFGLAEGTKLTGLGKIAGIGGLSGLAGLLAAQEAEDEEDINISDIDRGEGLDIDRIVRLARMNDPQFRFLPSAEFTTAFAEGGGVGSLAMNEENVKQKFVSDEAGALPKKGGGVTPNDMGKLKKSDFDSEEDYQRYLRQLNKKAEGGLMDLGGMEMDLRGGGFVPLGAKEKADDVPARLSKNEFVMTADAVRAAGGGSIDKGADKMYNLMKDLEAQV
jgi:hypothetical protein